MSIRLAITTTFLSLATLPLLAQGFTESTSTVVVEIPVQVIRDGEPVRGLTREDFAVFDGRHRQQITGFEVVDLSQVKPVASPGVAPELSPAARRHFLLLFDLAFSDPKSVVKAREAAVGILDRLHSTDLVGVATYTSFEGPKLILGFTPDRAQIEKALAALAKPEMMGRNRDLLRLVMDTQSSSSAGGGSTGSGRTGVREESGAAMGEAATDLLQTLVDQSTRAERRSQQTIVQAMTRSLADLAKMMGSVQGRKFVVYLSEGFDSALVQGTNDDSRRDELNAASQSGESWLVSSEELFGDSKSLNDVERMLQEFRRADCVVQSVDIAGLRSAEDLGNRRTGGKDTLLNFAKSTGGELFENFNDLGAAMGQMLDRTSVTYLLSFQPGDLEWNGSFHRLKVELQNARGARVVYRPGYYAPKPYAERSPFEKLLDAQSQVVAGQEEGTLDVAVLAAPFALAGQQRAYVPVLVEVDGKSLLQGKPAPTLPTELYVYAFDSHGTIQDFVNQSLAFEVAKVRPALLASGFKFFGHLELPPGDYSLRVLVRNGNTGDSGLRILPLHVPAFAAAEAALLPPFLPEPPDRWLLAREQPRGDFQQAPYPFLLAGVPYIPSSRPVLSPGEEAQLALVGYSLGDGRLEAKARVLTPDGREVASAAIQVLKREAGAEPARLVANVTPPQLPPGEYRLEVKLSGKGPPQTSSVSFVVRGG